MRHVLLLTSNLGGGTGHHLARLLQHMDPQEWRFDVLCLAPMEVELPDHVSIDVLSSEGRAGRFPTAQIKEFRAVLRNVLARRPDIVHTYFFWPIVYGRLLRSLGIVKHLVENREDEGFNWNNSIYRALRLTSRAPDRVICVSRGVRSKALEAEGLLEQRAVVVRNGIAVPPSYPWRAETQALRAELGLHGNEKVVGMVANLNRPVKGVGYFVEAMPLIAARVPQVHFLIVGEGRERAEHEARVEELKISNRVTFTGYRSDVMRFYPIMDVSVLTSLSEGLSITMLESMSFGIPVVATRVGGNPELVQDGETGFLVPPADPESFARAVIQILTDESLREKMGRQGRMLVESEFSIERVAGQYQRVYKEVLGDPVG